ncbi:NADPH:quinone oxidoreductase family protein [Sphingomonas solaris]|uniref:NADPH:quinone oxidoreductase family protein n=1 Tax=Alterirhizorhabdus solaris TaxID=2529389 RepID=A0A558RBH1_9SPHN|nr:NADPH:quinone oxidoreductase family protein [Sphingomonas solaris]TVV76726.1 NADPH:quinone oxidoreductase family protein [Sphingomonas solaris]
MRALICDAFGQVEALRPGDLPDPVADAGEVVVAVACAGAGFADALVVEGKHVARPPFPFVPGSEAAGTVLAIGPGVTRTRPGERVMAFGPRGAFAERMVVAETGVFPLPAAVPFAAGAASLVNYGTALHALADRAAIRPGETLLVLGAAGSVGLAAVEIGRLLGARVIAAASTLEKRALATAKGADVAIDYTGGDFRETLRTVVPDGIDVVFDPVGGTPGEVVARALRHRGRHLIVGFASGTSPRLAANLYLVKQADALGVMWGERRTLATQGANIARIGGWLASGDLAPVIGATAPLAEGAGLLRAILDRTIAGKAVIAVDRDRA